MALLCPGAFRQARLFPAFLAKGAISRHLAPSICLIDESVVTVTPMRRRSSCATGD
jgi:hypothetical protein